MDATVSKSDCYFDRNQLAQAFAQLARLRGWTVGLGIDKEEPDWPVLFVDTPFGQVSWHLARGDVVAEWDAYEGAWDGHTTADKRSRLEALIEWLDGQDRLSGEK